MSKLHTVIGKIIIVLHVIFIVKQHEMQRRVPISIGRGDEASEPKSVSWSSFVA
jgi:hypothetical protein